MPPQAPWSPTAQAFAHHQFSHVANFWKQGRQASFQLEALPGGLAKLNLTFHLPSASELVPPPFHVSPVPVHQRPAQPLFPRGCFPQGSDPKSKPPPPKSKPPPSKVTSRRQRKNYQRSVLHRAALAATSSTLPPPKNGSLRQAASACVQRLQAGPALQVNAQTAKKRPLDSTTSLSNISPLAQRIRADFKIGESEIESPEKEVLRSQPSPEKALSPTSPSGVKGFPPPAPLAFTPAKLQVDIVNPASESREDGPQWTSGGIFHLGPIPTVKVKSGLVVPQVIREDSDWETIDECENDFENDFPTIDVNCENWAEKFTESIQRFHNSGKVVKCENCDEVFTPNHQC